MCIHVRLEGLEDSMFHLQAGRDPHLITRQCRDRKEAERWAVELIQLGFAPVIIDGAWFDPGQEAAKVLV
jgi:hypothetical protein